MEEWVGSWKLDHKENFTNSLCIKHWYRSIGCLGKGYMKDSSSKGRGRIPVHNHEVSVSFGHHGGPLL
jgi:hypothetical protein